MAPHPYTHAAVIEIAGLGAAELLIGGRVASPARNEALTAALRQAGVLSPFVMHPENPGANTYAARFTHAGRRIVLRVTRSLRDNGARLPTPQWTAAGRASGAPDPTPPRFDDIAAGARERLAPPALSSAPAAPPNLEASVFALIDAFGPARAPAMRRAFSILLHPDNDAAHADLMARVNARLDALQARIP